LRRSDADRDKKDLHSEQEMIQTEPNMTYLLRKQAGLNRNYLGSRYCCKQGQIG
jgi:hypothetical protein